MKKFTFIFLSAVIFLSACAGEVKTTEPTSSHQTDTTAKPEHTPHPNTTTLDLSSVSVNQPEIIELTLKPQSKEKPIMLDGLNFMPGFQRGINFGNMLESPTEGSWGVRARDEYFKIVKDMGFDFIRLPIRWNNYTSGRDHQIKKSFLDRVDHLVAQALKNELGLIINIHHFDALNENPKANEEKLYAIWRQLAIHYADLPLNVVFEVNNEPHSNLTQDLWIEYQNKCIEIIREYNPTRKILVTGADWGGPNTVPSLVLPKDDNLLVSFHHYDPFQFTHQGAHWTGDNDAADSWVGTEWHGTEEEIKHIEQPFARMRAWSEATGIPVVLGEFGAYEKADMASRARWTAAMRELSEAYGFAWAYWEFCSGFGVYDPNTKRNRQPLVDALTGVAIPDNYGYKTGSPKFILEETEATIGPARMDMKVNVICDSWTGMTLSYTEDSTVIVTLDGTDKVPDWAQVYIPLPEIKDSGRAFSARYIDLTFRNIDNSITDFCFNIDNGTLTEAQILWPRTRDLLSGNKNEITINDDGTTTIRLDISKGHSALKGKVDNGIRIKMFVESVPEPYRVNTYDRIGALEFIKVEMVE